MYLFFNWDWEKEGVYGLFIATYGKWKLDKDKEFELWHVSGNHDKCLVTLKPIFIPLKRR